jgi:antiviral helicase SKI2
MSAYMRSFQTKRPRTVLNAQTSTSLLRDTAPATTFVRGKSGYLPFKPGGLDDAVISEDTPTAGPSRQGEGTSPFA